MDVSVIVVHYAILVRPTSPQCAAVRQDTFICATSATSKREIKVAFLNTVAAIQQQHDGTENAVLPRGHTVPPER